MIYKDFSLLDELIGAHLRFSLVKR